MQHEAAHPHANRVLHDAGRQIGPEWLAVWLHQAQFAQRRLVACRLVACRLVACKELLAHAVVDVLVILEDATGQPLADQRAPGHAQQGGGGEVGLQDQPPLADGAISHRRHVVEVEVTFPRGFQFQLRPAQFLVLHHELDLVYLQFVQHLPHCFGREGRELLRRQVGFFLECRFGPLAQRLP